MTAQVDALNYPYIRIRNVDWLKRTLLLFPHVVRMTVSDGAPRDDPEVAQFCWQAGRGGEPLLRPAYLHSKRVRREQLELMMRLATELEDVRFRLEFSRPSTYAAAGCTSDDLWDQRLRDSHTFQMHKEKLLHELLDFLLDQGLAWRPESPHGANYIEMNRRLGEAVMATLAFACAEDEDLRVITEFPELHGRVIHRTKDQIFSACLHSGNATLPDAEPMSAEVLAQFFIYVRCDVTKLTAGRLASLTEERQAIAAFRDEIEKIAAGVPSPSDPGRREAYLNDAINDVLRRWKQDRANMGRFCRELLGHGTLRQSEKAMDGLLETVLGPEAGTLAGSAVHGIVGAAAGLAVGYGFKALRTAERMRRPGFEGPFRYLSMMAREGVVFSLTR